jgi:protein-S-isoprenylcysteine O-methyltransferase Ste14
MSEKANDNANVRIHPPVLMLIHLAAAFLLGWLVPITLPQWVEYVGWAVVVFGLAAAFGGLRQLIEAHTSPDPQTPTTSVVTTGVYRFTRNPIYLGYFCMTLGLPLIFGNIWGLVAGPIQAYLFNRFIITREESYLSGKFGQDYLDYKSSVRRWL